MHSDSRYLVAYIAGRLIAGVDAASVYDFGAGKYRSLTGDVTPERINLYDFDRRCHINGSGRGRQFTLYDFGRSAHLNLKLESGGRFSGYEYDTGSHFNGSVNGRNVSLFDFAVGKHFSFSI